MELFEKMLCPAFEKVQFNPRAIFNQDKSAFFRKSFDQLQLNVSCGKFGQGEATSGRQDSIIEFK